MSKQKTAKMIQKISAMGAAPKVDGSRWQKFFKPEEMPAVDATPIGRHRLVQAFKNKYGETFRNKPGVAEAIKDFDDQAEFIKKAIKLGVE